MIVIAIDGPAGSGKSTIAAALATRLGLRHVDTGALYRAVTLAVLRANVDLTDDEGCAEVAGAARIERREGRTYLDGADVEAAIRGSEVTAAVSQVSAHPAVRTVLLAVQRAQVGAAGAVVEGRDIGAVVLPDAELKVWLTASPQARGRRRASQLGDTSEGAVAAHAAAIAERDASDKTRMLRAPDAIEVDATERDVASLVDELAVLAVERSSLPPTT